MSTVRAVVAEAQGVELVDERLPLSRLLLLGLQHVFVMYSGDIAVPLIISSALHLPPEQTVVLINSSLFAAGIATIVQCIGFWYFGARLPVMMGATFLSVSPMIAMGLDPGIGLRGYYGALIVSGLIGILAAPLIGWVLRLFPPVVSGSLITLLGLSLLTVAIGWVGGGQATMEREVSGVLYTVSNPDFGSPTRLLLAAFVVLATLLLGRFARGIWSNLSIMLGILAGTLVSIPLHEFTAPSMRAAPWISFTAPLHFGMPTFHLGAIITLTIVMLITLVESSAVFLALGEITGRRLDERQMQNALRADGLGILVGGLFNAFPYTSYSQNVGLVSITGVRSRYVCAVGGVILVALSLLPRLGYLVAAIPQPVLGGAGLIMFGMVAVAGIRILSEVDFRGSQTNVYVAATSLACGLIPTLAPSLLRGLPKWSAPITQSGVVLGSLVAIAVNALLNGYSSANRSGKGKEIP